VVLSVPRAAQKLRSGWLVLCGALHDHWGSQVREQSMRIKSSLVRLALSALGLIAAGASATEELRLVESINHYRSEVRSCAGQAFEALPPLASDSRLILPVRGQVDLQPALNAKAYPFTHARAISLSGPRDNQAVMAALQESFCQILLDPQFIDIGVSHEGRDWRIVLGRPLLSGGLGDWQVEGQKLLEEVNAARNQARRCGAQSFAAAPPLTWNARLGVAAEDHSRAMANGNFFSHLGSDGRTPGDRAELAGYDGRLVGENIAAALEVPGKVVDGWLASPGHCANLMNPQFGELGAAYAIDPQSDAGIYWTAMFGTL